VKLDPRSALGAQFGGFSAIAEIPASGIAVCETADVACLLVTAAISSADICAKAGAAIGVELPCSAGMVITHGGLVAVWFSPKSWLILCGVKDEIGVVARVNATFLDKLVYAALFTDHFCWFELRGLRAKELLQKGGLISFERGGLAVGRAKQALIAGVAAVVIHKEEEVWQVGIERSRARYFADWLTHQSS
jgi:heterotetrameric sarcosine oxidase gamma subunit